MNDNLPISSQVDGRKCFEFKLNERAYSVNNLIDGNVAAKNSQNF